MSMVKAILQSASKELDDKVEFIGLMSMKGVIKNGAGTKAEDVLGFDYVMKDKDGVCWSYYAANPPLIGMTQPVHIECPLGIVAFNSYEIDYIKAITILDSMNCGDVFTSISLSWPLVPTVKEPCWFIRTSIGNDVVIGADSGDGKCHSPIIVLYRSMDE